MKWTVLFPHLLQIDRWGENMISVFLLQLLQCRAQKHQRWGELQLQHTLLKFHLTREESQIKPMLWISNYLRPVLAISDGLQRTRPWQCNKRTLQNEGLCVTCSLLSLSLFLMSSIRSRAFSRSWRSFCQYFSSSLTACNFASGSL